MQTSSKPSSVVIWSQANCPACEAAKRLAESLDIHYEVKMLDTQLTKELFFKTFPGARSVPQIVADGKWLGGFEEFKQAVIATNTKVLK